MLASSSGSCCNTASGNPGCDHDEPMEQGWDDHAMAQQCRAETNNAAEQDWSDPLREEADLEWLLEQGF